MKFDVDLIALKNKIKDCISNVTSKNQQFVNDQLVFGKLLILAIFNDQLISLWQIVDFSCFKK